MAITDGVHEKSRIEKLLASQPAPKRLFYTCEMPRLTEGGLDFIGNWITAVPQPRLVIIDTLITEGDLDQPVGRLA